MTACGRKGANSSRFRCLEILALLASIALPTLAQSEAPEPTPPPPPPLLGSAISIPIPVDPRADPQKTGVPEIPELAGATHVSGSMLVDGELPTPFVDYWSSASEIVQRISIFQNGLVVARLAGGGGRLLKKLLIPQDALSTYRRYFRADEPEEVDAGALESEPTGAQTKLRIYRRDGTFVERTFGPSVILPWAMERKRLLMQDLLRAIAQDRDITNPIAGYRPRLGDELIGDDQRLYIVTRVIPETDLIEVTGKRHPVKMFVEMKDLPNFFIGVRKPVETTEALGLQ